MIVQHHYAHWNLSLNYCWGVKNCASTPGLTSQPNSWPPHTWPSLWSWLFHSCWPDPHPVLQSTMPIPLLYWVFCLETVVSQSPQSYHWVCTARSSGRRLLEWCWWLLKAGHKASFCKHLIHCSLRTFLLTYLHGHWKGYFKAFALEVTVFTDLPLFIFLSLLLLAHRVPSPSFIHPCTHNIWSTDTLGENYTKSTAAWSLSNLSVLGDSRDNFLGLLISNVHCGKHTSIKSMGEAPGG